jgi:hypothetical protein
VAGKQAAGDGGARLRRGRPLITKAGVASDSYHGDYNSGAENTIYAGGDMESYLLLPVIRRPPDNAAAALGRHRPRTWMTSASPAGPGYHHVHAGAN